MTAGFKTHVGGEAHGTAGHTDSCKISIPLLLTAPLVSNVLLLSCFIVHNMRERALDSNRANDSTLYIVKIMCDPFHLKVQFQLAC